MKTAYWIIRRHLFGGDEYVCSACHASFRKPSGICPSCRRRMRRGKYDPVWVDEAEELSALTDPDW